MDLFSTPTIELRPLPVAPGGWPGFDLYDATGVPLGAMAVTGTSWDGRLRRWLGNPAEYPFRMALTDPAGSLLLQAEKVRENTFLHLLRVDVALADGTPVGRVQRRTFASWRITFATDEHAVVASARCTLDRSVRVEREPGRDVEWAQSELIGSPRRADRTYRLGFSADAPLLVRMLLVAWTAAADAQLLPLGGNH